MALLTALVSAGSGGLHAEASGPDYWRVVGVTSNDVLNLRQGPTTASSVVATIPPNARGLRNLGCRGVPSFADWQRMSEQEKAASARRRWCRIEYRGLSGWVAGRFLAEDGSPP